MIILGKKKKFWLKKGKFLSSFYRSTSKDGDDIFEKKETKVSAGR